MGLNEQQLQRIDDIVATRAQGQTRGRRCFATEKHSHRCTPFAPAFSKPAWPQRTVATKSTGFQMAGEIIGLDGIVNDHHTCDAVALEDAEVCVMPFDRIGRNFARSDCLAKPCAQGHEPRDCARAQRHAAAGQHACRRAPGCFYSEFGATPACARLLLVGAGAAHDARRNWQAYLGLKLETVSRTFSKFVEEGMVEVKQRHVRILGTAALQRFVNSQHECNK